MQVRHILRVRSELRRRVLMANACARGRPMARLVLSAEERTYLERQVRRVIADEGIAQKVNQAEWQAAINTLIEYIRNGQIAAGFVAAIEHCGAILAAHTHLMALPTSCQTASSDLASSSRAILFCSAAFPKISRRSFPPVE